MNKVSRRIAERVLAPLDITDRIMLVKLLSELISIEDMKGLAHEATVETQQSQVKVTGPRK